MKAPRLLMFCLSLQIFCACSGLDDSASKERNLDALPHQVDKPQDGMSAQVPSLAGVYRDTFSIGTAVTAAYLENNADFVAKHFARLTAEWEMKWQALQPQEGVWDFVASDKIVQFTQDHHMKMTGHTLVWHGANPGWLFRDAAGKLITKELLAQRMHDYIFTVMGRYRGKIDNWDVVNEAISDNPNETYRKSDYFNIFGSEEYIAYAFEQAAVADPDAQLWYNDYSVVTPEKLAKVVKMVRWLKSRNIKIYGVGLQAHYNIYWPSQEMMENVISQLVALGLKVKISELDLTIYNDYVDGVFKPEAAKSFTPELEAQQAKEYGNLFTVFRAHAKDIAQVTLWGLGDDSTWLDNSVKGRKDYPLLFDAQHQPKKAFWSVVNQAQKQARQQGASY